MDDLSQSRVTELCVFTIVPASHVPLEKGHVTDVTGGVSILVFGYTPFKRSSWLDELAIMLAGRASSMFARRLLDVCSMLARSCKRGISFRPGSTF